MGATLTPCSHLHTNCACQLLGRHTSLLFVANLQETRHGCTLEACPMTAQVAAVLISAVHLLRPPHVFSGNAAWHGRLLSRASCCVVKRCRPSDTFVCIVRGASSSTHVRCIPPHNPRDTRIKK